MKAIVKIHTGGQARRELAYCLDPNAKNKRSRVNREAILLDGDEIEQTNERVGAVYAMGVNLTALKACQIDAVVSELEQRPSHLRRRGKYTRHAVISVEPESITNEDDVNESLKKCAEDWLVSFAPKSRAVIIRHDNSRCPHVHIIVENYDCALIKAKLPAKRLDWQPRDVKEMQDFHWTKEFETGRGSKSKTKANKSPRAKIIDKIKRERRTKDAKLSEKLVLWFKASKIRRPQNVDDLLILLQQQTPPGWNVKDTSKAGNPLKRPSISNGQTTVRLTRFWDWLTHRKNKSKEPIIKKCVTCGKSSKKCECGTAAT